MGVKAGAGASLVRDAGDSLSLRERVLYGPVWLDGTSLPAMILKLPVELPVRI